MREVEVPTYVKTPSKTSRPKMFEPNPHLFFDTHTLAPRMLLDPRDAHPRVRLFNPSDEAITVNIHRCLGTVDDAFDIGMAPHGVPSENSTSVRMHQPMSSAEPQGGVVAPPPDDSSLEEVYDSVKEDIPEHLKQLVSETISHLEDEEERKAVNLVLLAYQDVFVKDKTDISKTDVDTGGYKPVCQPLRRQSKEEHDAMVSIVNNLKRCGIIQPSRSQWAANIRMAKKKSGCALITVT